MNTREFSNEWFEMAKYDLEAAEYLLNMRPIPIEIICFHCEQSVEKMLKGALVRFELEPPRTHDLVQLCKQCCEENEDFEQFIDPCIELPPYGVQTRYPSEIELEEIDMKNALKEARRIYDFITTMFVETVEEDNSPTQTL